MLGPVSQSLLRKAIADGRLRRGMSQSDLAEADMDQGLPALSKRLRTG